MPLMDSILDCAFFLEALVGWLALFNKDTSTPLTEEAREIREAEMLKKLEIDLGLVCGVMALLLTILALFEPIRSWWFIVPVLFFAALMVIATILKSFCLYPFPGYRHHRKILSAAISISVIGLFSAYGYRIRPLTSYEPTVLRQMSNGELKEAAKKLTDGMREYQKEYNQKNGALFARSAKSTQKQDVYAEMIKLGNEFRGGFYQNYQGRACAIRDEFLWRLGKTPQQAEEDVLANLPPMEGTNARFIGLSRALAGVVAGPEPISDAAEFLDGLAKQLR